ncbi:MAG: hypothetical protein RXS23_03400 [Metallosphaera yellowstonensis]
MTSTIDLDSYTCSSDPLEALGLVANVDVTFSISKDSPLLSYVFKRYRVEIVRKEGEKILFKIRSDGSPSTID